MKKSIRTLLLALCLMGVCHGADESSSADGTSRQIPEIPDQAIMYSLSGAGWEPDKTMQAFCKWFKPQEKGIKLSDKYKAIYFAIAFPEIKHGAAVYIYELPADVAKAMQSALKIKNSALIQEIKAPMMHTARIVSNRLIIIQAPARESQFTEKLINNIEKFVHIK